jgi:GTP-binding protein YchF
MLKNYFTMLNHPAGDIGIHLLFTYRKDQSPWYNSLMQLKIGVIGLPNAGKSTLFNALLKKQVADTAPYPFCTIEPNIGVVPVPDERLIKLAEITAKELSPSTSLGTSRPPIVPAVVEFVDIAGLVAGASKGEGLGNKFLSHIREVDLICHVVRNFVDPSVVHVAGEINPVRDKDIVETELILADLQTLEKQIEPKGFIQKNTERDMMKRWECIVKLKETLNAGKNARDVIVDEEESILVSDLHLLTMKPVLYVVNVSENQLGEMSSSGLTRGSKEWIPDQVGNDTLVICAKTEAELASLTPVEQKEYLAALGVGVSGLDLLIQKTYQMLGLISFLTTGVIESRAWTLRRGDTALRASQTIHTDFAKKFIKAEVISYNDFIEAKGWKKAREEGKVRQEGKEYVMQDGDVVEFKVGA